MSLKGPFERLISERVYFITQFMEKGDKQKRKGGGGDLGNNKRPKAISELKIYGRSLSQHDDSSEV